MREKILKDIMQAMKDKDKDKLAVLRMVKGAMQLEEIAQKKELTDDDVIAVLAKQVKTRRESIEEFKKGNREDLIAQTEKEIAILNEYLPAPLTEDEIKKIIADAISEVNPQGPSDMGKIMKIVSPQMKGKADMSHVSALIREQINSL